MPPACYTEDWRRTEPDLVVYLPSRPGGPDADNEHLIINLMSRSGVLLATWTTATYESAPDSRTVFSHSPDLGQSWSAPQVLPGTGEVPMLGGRWGVHLVSPQGRVYFFFNRCVGIWSFSHSTAGVFCCVYSDDEGHTWQDGGQLPVRRRPRYDHPDPQVPSEWIIWQPAIRDARGRWLAGLTRWSSLEHFPRPASGQVVYDARCELLRFDNLDENPHPRDLQLTWLPEQDSIGVPVPVEPERSRGYAMAEEPAIVLLPDDRLFMVMRTRTGQLWYTVSGDHGHSWRSPEVLCQHEGGPPLLHPKSPAPLYRLEDGRYLLFFHNHDGTGYGAHGPHDMNARRPVFMALGEFCPGSHQPIWFGEPRLLFDSHGVALGPGNGTVEGGRTWLALYGCITEHQGKRIFWYPDRKHFLLGRYLPDALLETMRPKLR